MKITVSSKIKKVAYAVIIVAALSFGIVGEWFVGEPFSITSVEVDVPSVEGESDNIDKEGRININTATREELMSIKGIGEVTAQKIIDYREANGDFEVVEELELIYGISGDRVKELKDKVYAE